MACREELTGRIRRRRWEKEGREEGRERKEECHRRNANFQTSRLLCPLFLAPRLLCPWDFPGKNARAGCHFLLQGIFPTQESNPCLLYLLHWQVGSLPPQEAPGTVTKKTFLRGGGWRKEFAPPYTTLVGKFTLTDDDAVGIYRAIKDSDSGKGLSARLSLMPRTLTCLEKRFLTKLLLAVFFFKCI